MNLAALRLVMVSAGFILAVVGIAISSVVARQLARMDAAALSASLFLRAREARRFIVIFGVGILLFVWMPFSELGELLTDKYEEVFEIVHDLAHLSFIVVADAGLVGLVRMLRRDNQP